MSPSTLMETGPGLFCEQVRTRYFPKVNIRKEEKVLGLYLQRNHSGNQMIKIFINCFHKAIVGCSQSQLGVLQQPAGVKGEEASVRDRKTGRQEGRKTGGRVNQGQERRTAHSLSAPCSSVLYLLTPCPQSGRLTGPERTFFGAAYSVVRGTSV